MRIPKAARTIGIATAVVAIAGLAFALGALVTGTLFTGTRTLQMGGTEQSVPPMAASTGAPQRMDIATESYSADMAAKGSADSYAGNDAAGSPGVATGVMIIRNSNLDMRVDKIESALEKVRAAVRTHDATITDLTITAGSEGGPRPLDMGSGPEYDTPASAYMTIRVQASRLDALESALAKTGTLVSQSGSSSDVTQQHIDMTARLDNLKAQEKRLRGFFDRATKVSDLIEVERELSRVRSEIESLQGQVDYLERQAAMSTLTLSLTERGPVVQPSGVDWGFVDAVRKGIQGAAALLTGFITLAIAILPLTLLVTVVWLAFRAVRSRRGRTGQDESATDENSSGDGDR